MGSGTIATISKKGFILLVVQVIMAIVMNISVIIGTGMVARLIDELIQDGYKEVTLLGQNVNAYGKDLYDDYTLGNLLEDIAKKDIPRIRFMTSHPWDFTDHMIEVIGKYPVKYLL